MPRNLHFRHLKIVVLFLGICQILYFEKTGFSASFTIFSFLFFINHEVVLSEEMYTLTNSKTGWSKKYHKYVTTLFLTVTLNGGIGNQLFEAFSLIGIAQKLNRTAVYTSEDQNLTENFKFLHEIVPNLRDHLIALPLDPSRSSEYFFPDDCCKYHYNSSLEDLEAKFLLLDGAYFQSFKYFNNIQEIVRDLLKPNENIRKIVYERVREEDRQKFKNCVHIRRGDFLTDGMHEGTNGTFTKKAVEFLNQKQKNSIFYMFSNDPDWVSTNIVSHLDAEINVEIMKTPADRAIEDLYFSQIWCDSVLITAPSSTFGWWLSYLSKNQKEVYYRDIFETNDQVQNELNDEDFFPMEWNKLVLNNNWNIVMKNR